MAPRLQGANEELYLVSMLYEKCGADYLVSNIGHQNSPKKFDLISSDPYPNSRGVKDSGLPSNINEIIQLIIDKKIDGLFVVGEDILNFVQEPNLTKLKESLEAMQFIAVLDYKLSSTAHFADLILPGATAYEKEGTFTNDSGRVQKIKPAIPPPGNARPDWEILNMLGEKFDNSVFIYSNPGEIMSDLAVSESAFSGISYDRVGMLGTTINREA